MAFSQQKEPGECRVLPSEWLYDFIFNLHSTYGVRVLSQSCPTLCTLCPVAHQAPLSMDFSRQETCSGLSFPPLGDLLEN